jgi:hypothetical protein
MMAFTPAVVEKFCELCDWAHTVWSIQKGFETDSRIEALSHAGYGHLFHNLSNMSVEYTLLQMAKLHDPVCQQQRINLTLEFVVDYGSWDIATVTELRRLSLELKQLYDLIRVARHRIIAHNDLATILADAPLGGFPHGADIAYFRSLEQFATIARQSIAGAPFEFTGHAETDIFVLLNSLSESVAHEA